MSPAQHDSAMAGHLNKRCFPRTLQWWPVCDRRGAGSPGELRARSRDHCEKEAGPSLPRDGEDTED